MSNAWHNYCYANLLSSKRVRRAAGEAAREGRRGKGGRVAQLCKQIQLINREERDSSAVGRLHPEFSFSSLSFSVRCSLKRERARYSVPSLETLIKWQVTFRHRQIVRIYIYRYFLFSTMPFAFV